MAEVKLYIGSGSKKIPGYLSVDINPINKPDIVADVKKIDLPNGSVSEIFGEAVFEHIWKHEMEDTLREWRRLLAHRGILRLHWIPDFAVICREYVENTKITKNYRTPHMDVDTAMRYTHGAYDIYWKERGIYQLHKDIYDRPKIRRILEGNGFAISFMSNVCYPGENVPVNINLQAVKV
jgi:predicted SAM-dependent methyltransferase